MVEFEIDHERKIDISKDPITEELVFEFKEKQNGDPDKFDTKSIQRVPIRVIANWSKIMYNDLDDIIYKDFPCDCPECKAKRDEEE